jgi:peptide/nickel transport system permease protein
MKPQTLDIRLPAAEQTALPVPPRATSASLLAQTARRLKRSKTALLGLGIIVVLILVALFADVLAPYNPIFNAPTETFQLPNRHHLLGTDQFGRDMWSPPNVQVHDGRDMA